MKPSEIIKAKIEAKGGTLKSRQVISVLEYLDEEWAKKHCSPEEDERFMQFWKEYPNKKARPLAFRSWKALHVNEELFNTIMKSLADYKRSPDWQKQQGKFIPHPASWLNQHRWEDVVGLPGNSAMDEKYKGL